MRTWTLVVVVVAVAAAAALLASCVTTTREITPWMRMRATVHFDRGFIAESGGTGPYTTAVIEQRTSGGWTALRGVDSYAGFGFAGGTRAVLGETLYAPDRAPMKLACSGDLRALPSDDGLVCVDEVGHVASGEPEPLYVRVARFDKDGALLSEQKTTPPVKRAPGAPLGDDVDVHFLGFLDDGALAFSILHVTPQQSFAAGTPISCTGYALKGDAWSAGPTLRTTTDALWQCNFPRPWRERLSWHVVDGKRRQDAHGEPNP